MAYNRSCFVLSFLIATSTVLILLALAKQFHSALPTTRDLIGLPAKDHTQTSASKTLDDLHLAEELWQQSVHDRTTMLAQGFSADPDKAIQDFISPYNVWDLFRPTFFCPFDLERVGKLGDGGKWVCGMSRYEALSPGPSSEVSPETTMVVYSFGVEHDSSFEAALLARTNAEIWGFDYSVSAWAEEVPESSRAHFEKAAIAGSTDREQEPPRLAVADIMAENGHRFVDVMKMDIESAEFGALRALMDATEQQAGDVMGTKTLPVGQLLVELHLTSKEGVPRTVRDLVDFFERLERLGMRPVWNEHNWIGDVGSGHPRFIEYTFINVEHFKWGMLGE